MAAVGGVALVAVWYYLFATKNQIEHKTEQKEEAIVEQEVIEKLATNAQKKATNKAISDAPLVILDESLHTKENYLKVLKYGEPEHNNCLATWYRLAMKMTQGNKDKINGIKIVRFEYLHNFRDVQVDNEAKMIWRDWADQHGKRKWLVSNRC